jgi:hypothetical protein
LGELQVPQEEPSSEHSKIDPVSLEEKPKLAEAEVVVPGGVVSMLVAGGVVSEEAFTVQLRFAGVGSVLPAVSVARTQKL